MQAKNQPTTATSAPLFIRERELITERGNVGLLPISRSTLLRKLDKGEFPRPVKVLGVRTWPRHVIEDWLIANVGVNLEGQPTFAAGGI
jgi:predicted DNA-binding transcriptional regulator AlpA